MQDNVRGGGQEDRAKMGRSHIGANFGAIAMNLGKDG